MHQPPNLNALAETDSMRMDPTVVEKRRRRGYSSGPATGATGDFETALPSYSDDRLQSLHHLGVLAKTATMRVNPRDDVV